MTHVKELMVFNDRGDGVPDADFLTHVAEWRKVHPNEPMFGPIAKYSWTVGGNVHVRLNPRNDGLYPLPDASGFLLCEHVERPDNLVLLDAYGKERKRLSVPWQLTRRPTPASAPFPSRFIGLTTPWANPATGEAGRFAVLAWVEYAGDYAFELDWHTGEFLWAYFLERG
jgi:hypothetical protein